MQLVRTLSAIALVGAAITATQAEDLVLTVGGELQVRAEHSNGKDTAGNDWSVDQGVPGKDDAIDFSLRRVYLWLKGKYGDDWKFNATIQSENTDSTGTPAGAANTTASRGILIRYAWIERDWKVDDGWTTGVQFGLQKAFFLDADYISDQALLFTTRRAASTLVKPRNVGIGWRLYGSVLNAGIDVQNNQGAKVAGTAAAPTPAADESEGLWTSARIEFAPKGDWFIAKRAESFLGKQGHGLVIGLDVGRDGKDISTGAGAAAGNTEVNITGYGADLLFHWDGLTAAADFRGQKTESKTITTGVAAADVKAQVFDIQAGYAFPLADGTVIEPALFFAKIDTNKDVTQVVNYGGADAEIGASGTEFGIGVNYYLNGHDRKIQLNYTNWKAESGDAKAGIVRLEFQQVF